MKGFSHFTWPELAQVSKCLQQSRHKVDKNVCMQEREAVQAAMESLGSFY